MAQNSTIEWTDTTWNPVTGCTKISAGCDNCYAARFSERFRGVPGHPFETGFDLTLRPERLLQPLTWKRPRMIFVNSMSDLFHKDIHQRPLQRSPGTIAYLVWCFGRTRASYLADRAFAEGARQRPLPLHR